jgi:hypothetical protein
VVADMVQAGRYDVVLVLNEDQTVLGLVRTDAVLRLAPRLPEAPVRMLPLQRVLEVKHSTTLSEAQALLDGEVDALLVQRPGLEGWTVLVRGDLEALQRDGRWQRQTLTREQHLDLAAIRHAHHGWVQVATAQHIFGSLEGVFVPRQPGRLTGGRLHQRHGDAGHSKNEHASAI